jgi:CHASE3 domain sensor protein
MDAKQQKLLDGLAKTNMVHKKALELIEKLVNQKQELFDENIKLKRELDRAHKLIAEFKAERF